MLKAEIEQRVKCECPRRGPTIPYPGGKGRLASTLVSFMPVDGNTYVEPCAGRGNIFWAAASRLAFRRWVLNDILTAPFFRSIREFGHLVNVPQRSREEFCRQRELAKRGDPRALLLEPHLCHGGGNFGKSGFGNKKGATPAGYTRTLCRCRELMLTTKVQVKALDWKALKLEHLTADDFVFFDPPYFNCDVRSYTNEFDFAAMIKLLSRAKFRWMLTEYRQDFYVKAFGEPFFERSIQCSMVANGKGRRCECAWKNF